MTEFISLDEFAQYLFDRQDYAEKAARIMHGMLKARSPRLSDISHRMSGKPAANYAVQQTFAQLVLGDVRTPV